MTRRGSGFDSSAVTSTVARLRGASENLLALTSAPSHDVPGVTPDHIDVRVDHHLLTIWGRASHGLPAEATYREYELVNYFRQFDLSAKVDESQIAADLKHGVLTLTLSKVADAQPRKIAVAVS